jgi:thymidylate synthase ThyX
MENQTPLETLTHVSRTLPNNGLILVLNTGALIGPEAEAMLQALHSRSIGGIKNHLEILKKRGAEKFMSTYYVGYGHKSIGDCGSCSIFIEGVSMLVAKAIQDWPLYAGQEASTRYIDFANQPFIDPVDTAESKKALESLRAFYLHGIAEMVPELKRRHPRETEENEITYEKAINARAFDIMRGFLPAGATTNLAWHSNLRQVADKLLELRHHPLKEVREVALTIEDAVLEAFPSSFDKKRFEETENYIEKHMSTYYFTDPEPADFSLSFDGIDRELLKSYREEMLARPPKTELPKRMNECGLIGFRFLLDFGSFRDVQRQRSVTQRMPLVVFDHGIHPWYLEQLTDALREEALTILSTHKNTVESLSATPEERQYFIPMGYRIPNHLTGTLPALTYVVELRSTTFVHPTLRQRAQQMGQALLKTFESSGLVLHFDKNPDRFNARRGEHDIVTKES